MLGLIGGPITLLFIRSKNCMMKGETIVGFMTRALVVSTSFIHIKP